MNIGWIFLICAFLCLILMAFVSGRRRGQNTPYSGLDYSASLSTQETGQVISHKISDNPQFQKIEAIKRYRETTGASLAEAKAAVERMPLAASPGTPSQQDDLFPRELEALLIQGRKIEAIKRYREQTGLGLREARQVVDRLEEKLLLHAPTSPQLTDLTDQPENTIPHAEAPAEDVRSLVLAGRKIEAIKRYREQTGLGLREAKAAIDLLEQSLHSGLEQG